MAGKSMPCTRMTPCKICGKGDWCNRVSFPNGDELSYCKRVHGHIKDTVIGKDGIIYILKKITPEFFYVWESICQYETNMEAWRKQNPQFQKKRNERIYKNTIASASSEVVKSEPTVMQHLIQPLPDERLDEIYSYFLSMLILEDYHRQILMDEWKDVPIHVQQKEGKAELEVKNMFEMITSNYKICSLPPEDWIRFKLGKRGRSLKNPLRKNIMNVMHEKFGDLTGVPGFYQKENGSWNYCYLSGICYPVYNTKGQIVRLRVADDFPHVEGEFLGRKGEYSFFKGVWVFREFLDGKEEKYGKEEVVYSYESDSNPITLTRKGFPSGKVKGKYKSFSSFCQKEVMVDGKKEIVNMYKKGCSATGRVSLYKKPGDKMSMVYFTEGEKKSMVANILLGIPVVCIPGVTSFGLVFSKEEENAQGTFLDFLLDIGMQLAVMAYDADKAVNAAVLKSEQNAVEHFHEHGVHVAVCEWNMAIGKGLDDVLIQGFRPGLTIIEPRKK